MSKSMLTIKEYLELTGLTEEALGRLVNVHKSTISRALNKECNPSYHLAKALEQVSGGKIQAKQFGYD